MFVLIPFDLVSGIEKCDKNRELIPGLILLTET